MKTSMIPVKASALGTFSSRNTTKDYLDELVIDLDQNTKDAKLMLELAQKLRSTDIPIAFPTETVYGLGADATRSSAVRGIFQAKQRPSDNPLIVHFASLDQIRRIVRGEGNAPFGSDDPIPAVYQPLIERFWPGPLTILLPVPEKSALAPEVTAGLSTFGARIPQHLIALALIQLSDRPIAAPSANASTKPSPTAAEHVAFDLNGRIETIIDGGPCEVGVESTVVDGLSSPPLILRPGGITLEQIRKCSGWEHTKIGYEDAAEQGLKPRAPGMKYRHYSPRAPVILYQPGRSPPRHSDLVKYVTATSVIGIVPTARWTLEAFRVTDGPGLKPAQEVGFASADEHTGLIGFARMLSQVQHQGHVNEMFHHVNRASDHTFVVLEARIGRSVKDIARGIFGALRDLDKRNVDAIFVEGLDDVQDDLAAAVMNRLRKAAQIII